MRFGSAIVSSARKYANNFISSLAGGGKGVSMNAMQLVSGTSLYAPPPAQAAVLLELYKNSPWVRTIVGKVAAGVARQCWYIEDKNGERVEGHPLLDFLNYGTGKIAGRRLAGKANRKLHQVYIELTGESHWVVGRNAKKQPASFAVVPPHWVQQMPTAGDPNYRINPKNGGTIQIPETEVITFCDPDVKDPFGRGNGITSAARVELDTDEAASNYVAAYFKNYARPDIIVSGTEEHPIGKEIDRARLEASWLEKFRGAGKAGRPMFSNLPLNIQEIGASMRDNLMVDMRSDQRKIVAEIWGVPPEVLGRIENSNRATIDSADYLMATWLIDPRLSDMRDDLQAFGDDEFGLSAAGLKLCYESPIKDDIAAKSSIMLQAKTYYTGNEIRALTGHAPLDELNELPPEPAPFDPFGMPPGGGYPKSDPKNEPPTDKKPAKNDPDTDDDEDEADDKAAPAAVTKGARMSADDIVKVSKAHEDPQVRAEATRIMQQAFEALIKTYGDELLSELESEARFSVNMDVANWLVSRSSKLMESVDETTRRALARALEKGVANDEELSALNARIEQLFEDAASTRAVMIGTTEATALTGFGSQAAAIQGGFQRKVWISSRDQVVRDSHKGLDGQIVGTSEQFVSPTGARADYPGGFGEAAEDINCRCAMRPMLDGEKSVSTKFDKLHARRFDHMAAGVKRAVESILMAQAVVAKEQLRRVLAPLAV